jgi:uncharacterized protein YfbU (UPF0304 family)
MSSADIPRTLSRLERLTLANQFKILAALHPDEGEDYTDLATIFERGYSYLYDRAFQSMSSEVTRDTSQEVFDILSMHRTLFDSVQRLQDKCDLEERIKFYGFDANNESEHLSFAKFFTKDGRTFEEVKVFNSHMPTLQRYRRMLQAWKSLGPPEKELTNEEVEAVLQAGTFNTAGAKT